MAKEVIRRGALLALVVLLGIAGCAQRRPAPQPAPEPAPAPTAPAPAPASASVPAPAPATGASSAATVDEYKRDFASRLQRVSSSQVFTGAPPNLLRSVIVLSVALDAAGNVVDARVLRDNGDRETVQSALDSVRRAAPYPRPAARLVSRNRLEFTESWLFREDGRFQLRTLAAAWQQ